MTQLESDSTWINRGRQKSAIARVLRKPMTPSEIWHAAQAFNPHIQLRDVWFILRQCERRGLVHCFSRGELTGKVYYWTDQGRAVIEHVFGLANSPPPQGISWTKYSQVARSKMRRMVLLELAQARFPGDTVKTATRVRHGLRKTHSVSLSFVIRALKELRSLKLIEIHGEAEKRRQKLYRLTRDGRRIAGELSPIASRIKRAQTLLNPASSESA
jgi:DNA-binding PadR family transcriptional regulator